MVGTGFGQVLVNGDWTADVLYDVTQMQIGKRQQYQVRMGLRRGQLILRFFTYELELVCANGVHYRISSDFTIDSTGWYVADLMPLPIGIEVE